MCGCNAPRQVGLGVLVTGVFCEHDAWASPPRFAPPNVQPIRRKKMCVRRRATRYGTGENWSRHKSIIDMITATIDVTKPPLDIKDRSFRLRRLEVEPGGIVPWHNHAERPAIAYLLEGKLTEYASNCAVPVEHTAGDVIVETPNLSHWWKNFGDKRAVVISADLLKGNDDNM